MILCVGTTPVYQRSMVFERLTLDEVNRAVMVRDYASGKSINVARVLHALGEEVVTTGFVGRGERGDALLADLDRAGIGHDFVRVAAPARQCVTVIDRSAGTATELVEESRPVAAGEWDELMGRLARLAPDGHGWVMSGSLPPGADDTFYANCLALVAKPVPVVLDTRRGPLRAALGTPNLIVKLNRDELRETVDLALDSDGELRAAVRSVAPSGGGVVVTAGPGGVVTFDGARFWRVSPPRVDARSAVGSGDAFAAGMTVGLLRGRSLPDACALGAACGAANAMTDLAGFLSPADVERLLPQVRIEPF